MVATLLLACAPAESRPLPPNSFAFAVFGDGPYRPRNATARFQGRTTADDIAVVRRTAAALEWLDSAFAVAKADSLSGVVIAMHGNPRLHRTDGHVYSTFVTKLREHTSAFPGEVLLIHGDTHEYTVDHPLRRVGTGEVLANFTRLETYGSPDIGWVKVVIDSVAGRVVEFEPRLW